MADGSAGSLDNVKLIDKANEGRLHLDLHSTCSCSIYKYLLVLVGVPLTGLTTPVGWLSLPPSDCPKFVRNRCVINVFVFFRCFFIFSVACRGFCHRTESDVFFFFFLYLCFNRVKTYLCTSDKADFLASRSMTLIND